MKIVRLTEDKGQTALFDNDFNDEILIPPFSEVALSSMAINVDPRTLEIGSSNDSIPWSIAGNEYTMDLDSIIVDETNASRLFLDIHSKMNDVVNPNDSAVGGVSPECGIQWICSDDPKVSGLGVEGKVSIGYQVANYEGGKEEAFVHNRVVEGGGATAPALALTYARSGGTVGVPDSALISKVPWGWGGARAYINLKALVDSGADEDLQGVAIGLTTTDHFKDKTSPGLYEGICQIHARHADSVYFVSNEESQGEDTTLPLGALTGDLIGFERVGGSDGLIEPVCYRAGSDTARHVLDIAGDDAEIYHAQHYADGDDAQLPLFPYVIFMGAASDTIIDQVQISPDPYHIIKYTTYPILTKTTGTRGIQNGGTVKPLTTGTIDFSAGNALSVAKYLGFSKTAVERNSRAKNMPADKFAWTGDTTFGDGLAGQGFYVEYMTGQLEGFDGQTRQRKNILAVIPESDSDNKILFQPSFPIFLELNNKNPLALRNIRARVLDSGGGAVGVQGVNSLTLLYRTPNSL